MKKVLSIVIAIALVLSCCVVAFASDSTLTAGQFAEYVGETVGKDKFAEVMGANNIDVNNIDPAMTLSTEQIYTFLEFFLNDGSMTADQARNCADSFGADFYNQLTDEQVAEIHSSIDAWDTEHNPPETPPGDDDGDNKPSGGDEEGGSGLPFDISKITDIFSNISNLDLSKFGEGAKSSLAKLFDGIKDAGLPDLSSITSLLSNIPGLDMIMSLIPGMGGDDNGGGSGTTPGNNTTPGTNTNSNTAVIPKTADTAPIAAVAALAAVAGVAFVLTRKKNED